MTSYAQHRNTVAILKINIRNNLISTQNYKLIIS